MHFQLSKIVGKYGESEVTAEKNTVPIIVKATNVTEDNA